MFKPMVSKFERRRLYMKNLSLLASLGVISLGLAKPVIATEITSDVYAHLLVPISMIESNSMNFGTLTLSTTEATTVTLTTGDSVTGDSVFASGSAQAATFIIDGSPNEAIDIQMVQTAAPIGSKGDELTLGSFTHNAGSTLNSNGTNIFNVGATLTIPKDAQGGTYSGSYTVTVAYN
jgi:Domain of unknown function (DUF4402)